MSMINFTVKKIAMPEFDQERTKAWIVEVASRHEKKVGDLTYIFCDDEKILDAAAACGYKKIVRPAELALPGY
mgnify:CR=1 FL=1